MSNYYGTRRIKKINARYGHVRYLERIGNNSYILYGVSPYIRGGEGMVDMDGGPMVYKNVYMCEVFGKDDRFTINTRISDVKCISKEQAIDTRVDFGENLDKENMCFILISTFEAEK